ncbi:hypothetical protein JD844_010115 [Phrynosoma platyrhinos]|uniref:NADH dehydrogenase [ubiquinone] 1 beta subcomplex subunit 4 n=1 Tax=Phrynosoma platyrhinos TaxID=52577 RepID=A0ABQ7TG25_PHRPL|nr:hypothetical protein JD844_010115 [Phrynosoma platyrhinos]
MAASSSSSSSSSGSVYRPAPLASLPPQLDPAQYDVSPEQRRAEAERLAIRARLKRHYLLQLNDPRRTHLIDYKEKLIQEGKYERPFHLAY